jgi:hypothetical protein
MARKVIQVIEDAADTAADAVAEICRACWPNGWPHLSHTASCEHGAYTRDPAADAPPAEEPPPADPVPPAEEPPAAPAADPAPPAAQ